MRPLLLASLFITACPSTWAFSWHDLWVTKNHQAQIMMNNGDFAKAQETFDDPAWKATAAFRSGHYKDAATGYQALKNNTNTYYNQGNALAQAGQLEPAIKAYDKALALDPSNHDALHNRKIIEEQLKKEKEKKQDQNKQDQNKQDQDKQDQNKQDQDKQDQNKQDQNKQDQDKQDQDKQDQDKQDQDKKNSSPETSSQTEREQQQAKEQWLRLIPDDPGGLLREKFMRDYLKRQREG